MRVSGRILKQHRAQMAATQAQKWKKVFSEIFETYGFCLCFLQIFEKSEQLLPVYNRDHECTIML